MPYDVPTANVVTPSQTNGSHPDVVTPSVSGGMPQMPHEPVSPGQAPAGDPLPAPMPTANEGVHPLAVSPEEGLFAVDQQAMMVVLERLLKLKYSAVIMYMNYGDRIRAHFRDAIYDHFQDHMKEEISFCYDLAMKITALGGEPSPKVSTVPDMSNIHHMFMNVIENEKEQIKVARDILLKAGDNTGLKVLIENMVLTDQRHADDARRMLLCEQG